MQGLSQQLKFRILIAVIAVVLVLSAIIVRNFFTSNDDGPLYSDERNRYIALEFYPKYNAIDCTVSFDVHLKGPSVQFAALVQDSFQHYVSYHEPRVGTMLVEYLAIRRNSEMPRKKDTAPFELIFSDQCNRKDEIFDAMVAYTVERHGGAIGIERLPNAKPELKPLRFWLDSPDYEPDYWPIYNRALRGDGGAFLELLRFEEGIDPIRQHLFFALAEHYLTDDVMKVTAKEGKDAAWELMKPEQQGRQNMLIEGWKSKIERYAEH